MHPIGRRAARGGLLIDGGRPPRLGPMSFLRAVVTVSGLTLASRAFGFVRDVMAAAIMGAGPVADAFFVALRLPNFFRRMTAEGAFSVSFVPLFTKTLEQEGRSAAIDFANMAMAFMLVILVPFSAVIMVFMPQFLHVLAPGFADDGDGRFELAVTLTRITFGYLLFMSLTALVGGMLNALDKFAAFAAAPVLFNVAQIIFLTVAFLFETPGHAMAWAVLLSGVLQFVWMLWSLRANGITMALVRPVVTEKIRRLWALMVPGMIGASAVQINLLVDTIIASTLPAGAVSYLYYADRLNQLPLGLIGTAVGTALLPKLASRIAAHDAKGSNYLFNRALEWTLLLTLPAAFALSLIADPIIRTLFERGAFDANASVGTARTLVAYAVGLPAFVGIKVLSTALYAQENTATPVKITLWCAALNIVLCLVLIRPLGHVGIALATSIAGWVQAGVMLWIIHFRNALNFDAVLVRNTANILGACAVMSVILVAGHAMLLPYFTHGGLLRAGALGALMAAAGGAYIGLILLRRVVDIKNFMQSLKGRDV